MFGWILEGLEKMDASDPGPPRVASLMPRGHDLELFVTTTDFHGYVRPLPNGDQRRLVDRRHRHVLEFRDIPGGRNQFDASHNPALAFAARATSSFPGAFPPINIAEVAKKLKQWPGQSDFEEESFRIYALSNAPVGQAFFVDGGVLDNFPFGHAIKAIIDKPAGFQVDRRLVYIEPDPGNPSESPRGGNPSWLATIWGALSGIPGHEPILDDLLKVGEFNERVRLVNHIVETTRPEVLSILNGLAAGGDYFADVGDEQIERWRDSIHEEARHRSGYAYGGYVRLKLQSVVEQIAELI